MAEIRQNTARLTLGPGGGTLEDNGVLFVGDKTLKGEEWGRPERIPIDGLDAGIPYLDDGHGIVQIGEQAKRIKGWARYEQASGIKHMQDVNGGDGRIPFTKPHAVNPRKAHRRIIDFTGDNFGQDVSAEFFHRDLLTYGTIESYLKTLAEQNDILAAHYAGKRVRGLERTRDISEKRSRRELERLKSDGVFNAENEAYRLYLSFFDDLFEQNNVLREGRAEKEFYRKYILPLESMRKARQHRIEYVKGHDNEGSDSGAHELAFVPDSSAKTEDKQTEGCKSPDVQALEKFRQKMLELLMRKGQPSMEYVVEPQGVRGASEAEATDREPLQQPEIPVVSFEETSLYEQLFSPVEPAKENAKTISPVGRVKKDKCQRRHGKENMALLEALTGDNIPLLYRKALNKKIDDGSIVFLYRPTSRGGVYREQPKTVGEQISWLDGDLEDGTITPEEYMEKTVELDDGLGALLELNLKSGLLTKPKYASIKEQLDKNKHLKNLLERGKITEKKYAALRLTDVGNDIFLQSSEKELCKAGNAYGLFGTLPHLISNPKSNETLSGVILRFTESLSDRYTALKETPPHFVGIDDQARILEFLYLGGQRTVDDIEGILSARNSREISSTLEKLESMSLVSLKSNTARITPLGRDAYENVVERALNDIKDRKGEYTGLKNLAATYLPQLFAVEKAKHAKDHVGTTYNPPRNLALPQRFAA